MDKDLLNKKIQNRYRGLLRVSEPLAEKDEMRSIREAFHYAMDACQNTDTGLSIPNGHLPMEQNRLKPRLRSQASMI